MLTLVTVVPIKLLCSNLCAMKKKCNQSKSVKQTPRSWIGNLTAQLRRWDSCQALVKSVFSCSWTDSTTDLSFKAETTATTLQLLDKMNTGEASEPCGA